MVDIIAVTYGQNEILKCFINSIKAQTSNNWKLILVHDGPNPELKKDLITNGYLVEGKIEFYEYHERTQNYGHILRSWALENLVINDYVLITNGDNYYVPIMIEEVEKVKEDFIYFDLVHSHKTKINYNQASYGYMNTKLLCSHIDMGSAVIRSEIAKKVGFNHVSFAADWEYFNDVLKLNPTTHKIDKILMVHN